MVQYVSRRRKGRSACRKAQTRALAHCQSQSHVAKSSTDDTASGIDSERSYETADSEHINRLSNKDLLHVKRLHKNTLRRERRAKSKIVQLQDATDSAYAQLSLVSEERDNAERALEGVKRQDNSSINEISVLRQQIEHLKQQISQASETVVRSSLEIHKQSDIITSFAARNKEIYLTKEALRKKVERRDRKEGRSTIAPIPSEYHTHAYSLKDKGGAIRPEVRNILRELACKGVGTEHASDIISIIAEGLGITVVGSVSARSIAQIMLEGLVQARMQIASELDQANHFTICGNGTSIKNHQYEAKSMYIQPRTEPDVKEQQSIDVSQPVFRTLGVQKALNHTAQHQFNGWIRAIDACCKALTDSPTGQNIRINSKLVAPKLRGVLTDHAADQKRFQELMQQWKRITDRERRAVPVLENMSTEAQFSMLSKHLDDAAISIGNWRELSADKQAALMHDAWLALALQIGEDEFLKHSPESQFEIDFFAWTGCCMHKELNAVKGGVAQMARTWEVQGLLPPIPLRNKFDAKKPAHSNAEDKATRGGIKLASLAGALFNNKDDKKGYQYTVDDFFKKVFGYSSRFPDISNTRYGSYCDAATELILHTEAYISLLEALRDSKGTPGFTNIESNIHSGLLDASTLTELAVLALYAQAIGRPYMRMVRSGSLNAMDLGPLHDQVKAHCRAIVCNPSLLLSPAALAATGTLDGENWDRPEVVYRVAYLGSSLPHLEPALVAFFEGALRTWVRFTTEFDSGSTIARATPEQRRSAWVPPTNDVSEGALGQCRQMLRRAPTMTDNQRNERVMWKKNNTHEWSQQTLTDSDTVYIRREARSLDASGDDRRVRAEINAALEERVNTNRIRKEKADLRKSATKEKLDQVILVEDFNYEALRALRVKDLDLQIDKLRDQGDLNTPAKSTVRTKEAKIQAILAAFERRRSLDHVIQRSPIVSDCTQSECRTTDTLFLDDSSFAEDDEMCFDDEVIF